MSEYYGKRITIESVQGDQVMQVKNGFIQQVLVNDSRALLEEMLSAVKLITDRQTKEVNITLVADPRTNEVRRIKKQWELD